MKAALVISDRDNVATALEPLESGRRIELAGRIVVVMERIPSGHKVALVHIAQGAPVIKYGSAIGTASVDILPGTHVHTHNVSSGRGRGDLGRGSVDPSGSARLAEPADADLEGGRASDSFEPDALGVGPQRDEERRAPRAGKK